MWYKRYRLGTRFSLIKCNSEVPHLEKSHVQDGALIFEIHTIAI